MAEIGTVEREERWAELRQLEDWLERPMQLLGFIWLALLLADLLGYGNALLETFGTAIWVTFIAEFALRLFLAPDRWAFLRHQWLTVLSLIVPAFRLFRAVRALRALGSLRGARLIRIVGSANRTMTTLRRTLARRRFGYVLGLTLLVVLLGAAGMLNFEPASEVPGGFSGYADALWWTAMLITTIGSAFWPVTIEGRVLCLLISIYGLAVLGYLTASIASFFIGRDADDADAELAGTREIAALRSDIAALRSELAQTRSLG